ncbi:N-acetylmuramoyl-L-alanine amidase [Sporosarcina sp. USHLN248]|uniref:peptidoglycan recognition protein family protein n=1 Tax=Sporosarcina sp. USHLN248 TaxID=3081300 RepID=UPI0030182C14
MATIKDLRPITPRTNGTRKLSAIKNIARHHSATTSGSWASFWPHWNKTNGWGTGGYHEIILRDGTVELCYDPEEITNGVGGQNSYIYNICLVGNGSFTPEQEKTFDERARYWMQRLGLPASAVKGHNEFPKQNTSCPGIDMDTVRARLSGASIAKEANGEMVFSSPSLKEEIEMTLGSKARRQMIVDQAIAAGYSKIWQEKLDNKTITNDDLLALGAGTSVRNSMIKVEDNKVK